MTNPILSLADTKTASKVDEFVIFQSKQRKSIVGWISEAHPAIVVNAHGLSIQIAIAE